MRGAVLYGPRDIRYVEREDPRIVAPTDVILRMSATCVCGSDLWPYRGMADQSRRDTIQSREDAWSEAFNANSKDGLGVFYEEEGAVLVPPGSPPVRGRAATMASGAMSPTCSMRVERNTRVTANHR